MMHASRSDEGKAVQTHARREYKIAYFVARSVHAPSRTFSFEAGGWSCMHMSIKYCRLITVITISERQFSRSVIIVLL